jgi:hypothetical protein
MSSLKQIDANRRNAQKSTGPASARGSESSSRNSFKTGLYAKSLLIRGENPEDFESLTREYYDRHQPQSPEERELIDALIRQAWQLRRWAAVEAQIWEEDMIALERGGFLRPGIALGQVFIHNDKDQKFARLHRMVAATQRLFRETLRELERLKSDRAAAEEPIPDPNEAPDPQNGFVPSNSREAATDPQSPAPSSESATADPQSPTPDPLLPLCPPINRGTSRPQSPSRG